VDEGTVRSQLRHRISSLFEQAGIRIAYPQRDIHLEAVRPLEIKLVNSPALPTREKLRSDRPAFANRQRLVSAQD
jgi:small-conductance mechanosensitive channel